MDQRIRHVLECARYDDDPEIEASLDLLVSALAPHRDPRTAAWTAANALRGMDLPCALYAAAHRLAWRLHPQWLATAVSS
jgi:hypothetical protein